MLGASDWKNDTLGCVGMVVPSVGLTAVLWSSLIGDMGDAGCL